MKTIQGFILIDVDVVALNNAGADNSRNFDNATKTKKIYKNGKAYPYVSGQAWRYWWRETLKRDFKWEMSPITQEKKIAYTEAEPFIYSDDDVFGYMRAKKIENENVTLTRISPLKNSALIAVANNPIVQNWASMTRQDGHAVPFAKDEYCAVMKGMFSIDIEQVGTFSNYNRSGFQNINDSMKKEYVKKGATEIDDPVLKNAKGEPYKLVRMDKTIREKRIKDTIMALKTINGGAMQTTNMTDVTPKLIVLAGYNSGNHPFSHLATDDLGQPVFSVEALAQVMSDYKDQFSGKLFVGRQKGFMDTIDEKLKNISEIEYGSPAEMIEKFCKTIKIG